MENFIFVQYAKTAVKYTLFYVFKKYKLLAWLSLVTTE